MTERDATKVPGQTRPRDVAVHGWCQRRSGDHARFLLKEAF